jgi:hypothetical protein
MSYINVGSLYCEELTRKKSIDDVIDMCHVSLYFRRTDIVD